MPLFSRRRLQQMLRELSPLMAGSKLRDFVSRLNDKRFEIALPAEAELALVWAVSRLGEFEPEPEWFSEHGAVPEGVSENLVPGQTTVFDVKALSDRVRPGKVGMRNVSRKLAHAANEIRKGSGKKLDFFFHERRDWQDRKNYREAWAPREYQPSPQMRSKLQEWLLSRPAEGEFIDVVEPGLAVRITWDSDVSSLWNHHSSGADEIFDLEDNHIASALREKARQLRSSHFKGTRGVLLVDVGCASLKRIKGIDPLRRSFSGSQIIQAYLDSCNAALDFVCVFSPQTDRPTFGKTRQFWAVTAFVRTGLEVDMRGLQGVASRLPAPRFDGYELESLHEQQAFGPQSRGWYLGSGFTTSGGSPFLKATFSARALHEFLAGRITGDRLRETLVGGKGAFEYQLLQGNTISEAKVIPSGLDEDDDLIELTFSTDPAAHPLVVPKVGEAGRKE